MLDLIRIREAEDKVLIYLDDGLLKKVGADKNVIHILLRNAQESLSVSEEISKNNWSDLWVIVCSYYSMYYYANAVLLKLGYKVGDKIAHKVTSDALITYVRKKLKASLLEEYEETKKEALNLAGLYADNLIESFDFERHKRNYIQYNTIETEKHSKSKTSLQRAKVFAKEMRKLLL